MIQNMHGICIEAPNYNSIGAKLRMEQCNANALGQRWSYDRDTYEFKIMNSAACLIWSSTGNAGNKVQTSSCGIPDKNHKWNYYPRQTHSYEIIMGNDGDVFGIDPASGLLSIKTQLSCLRDDNFERSGCTSISFEQRSSFLLYIRVTDNGFQNKNKLSGTGKITVKINDVNEAPRFLSQERTVDEQTPGRNPAANYNGQCGAPLSATDEDGDMVRFNITDAAASQPEFPFGVDAVSGQISVRVDNVLDFEGPQNTFKFEVTCYDVSPGKESKYTRATVTILLQDVNENPVVEEEYFQIPEDFSTVSKIGRVNVFDVDAGQEVFRSIVSGNTHDAFRMVRDGTLFVMEDGILKFEQ
jgi:hypothetical protein